MSVMVVVFEKRNHFGEGAGKVNCHGVSCDHSVLMSVCACVTGVSVAVVDGLSVVPDMGSVMLTDEESHVASLFIGIDTFRCSDGPVMVGLGESGVCSLVMSL